MDVGWGVAVYVCACVLKPQAMKLCVRVCVSLCVCLCVRVCKGRESVGECRRQTCQFHSWFLWLEGSGLSRVTLGITAPRHKALGKHTIIYCRQMYTQIPWLAALTHKTKRAVKHTTWVSHHTVSGLRIFSFFLLAPWRCEQHHRADCLAID